MSICQMDYDVTAKDCLNCLYPKCVHDTHKRLGADRPKYKRQVIELRAKRMTVADVAVRLQISPSTVKRLTREHLDSYSKTRKRVRGQKVYRGKRASL